MDTKWKNRLLLIVTAFLLSFGLNGILGGLSHAGTYVNNNYFETAEFNDKVNRFIEYLGVYELNYIPKEEAVKRITVSREEINEHRYRYGNLEEQIASIKSQYDEKINQALAEKDEVIANTYKEERDRKIEDITNNFKSDEYVRKKIIKEKEQMIDVYYEELEEGRKEFLAYQALFVYHLTDVSTGDVYTNETDEHPLNRTNMAFIKNYAGMQPENRQIHFNEKIAKTIPSEFRQNFESLVSNNSVFEGKIGVPRSVIGTGVLEDYDNFKQRQLAFYLFVISSLIAFAASIFIYKKYGALKNLRVDQWQSLYNKIPLDIRILAILFTGIITFVFLSESRFLYSYGNVYHMATSMLEHLLFLTAFLLVTLIQGRLLRNGLRSKEDIVKAFKKTVTVELYRVASNAFLLRKVGTQIVIMLGTVYLFGLGAIVVFEEPPFVLIYAPLFLLIMGPMLLFIIRRAGYFNQIVTHSNELVHGNFEQDLPVKGRSALADLARNLNKMKHGVKVSQKEQAKSERLKTELITNVSHDLRTPLTSIITYAELLKKSDLTSKDRDAYVQIIDRKSQRLKVLIDDLFEASKMASGNIELVKEKVDLVQLLQQALAEYNEKMNESTLQFRITMPETPVYALVDGQKLWRVFDNLIGNMMKYSLENTRVYITMESMIDRVVISFKNVTKYELSEDTDELFERFKRGDTSRNTEGSGLGLAIAKSIIDLHDGEMDMTIDGDLFKVIITLYK